MDEIKKAQHKISIAINSGKNLTKNLDELKQQQKDKNNLPKK